MHLCLLTCLFAVVPLLADEATKHEPDAAQPVDAPIIPETVDLLDGAETAEGALKAFAAASKAADDEAALLMVDPPIRRLLIPEIAIERFAIDSKSTELAFFGEEKKAVGGMLFYYARRDLINLQSIEILNTRVVDDDRIVFTVYSIDRSYHMSGNTSTVHQFLTVRRSGRWYVFRLFGTLTHRFRDNAERGIGTVPFLKVLKGNPDRANPRDADFELKFHVPIESIHEELVRSTELPATAECLVLASRLERLLKSVENRANRGEYNTRGELRHAFDKGTPWTKDLLSTYNVAIQFAMENLAKSSSIDTGRPDPK